MRTFIRKVYTTPEPLYTRSYELCVALVVGLFLIVGTGTSVSADTLFGGLQESREYRAAVGLLKQGDYELARKQYKNYIRNYPDSERIGRAYFGLAETYYLRSNYAKAAEIYLKSLRNGDLSDNYHEQALERGLDAANRSGRYELGQDYIDSIDHEMNRVTDTIMQRVVQILAKNNQTELALKWSQRSFDENPESHYWRYETAVLRSEVGQFDRARELLEPLLSDETDYRNDATYLMAEINFESKNYDRAGEYYNKLTSDSAYRDDARYGLAWIEIKERNMDRAKSKLKALADSSREIRGKAARDLARIYRSEGNDDATRTWYQRAIDWSSEPARSQLRIEFGDYFVNTNRLKQAIPHYEAARGLGLKGTKRLVRGHLLEHQYSRAARELEKLQKNENLTGPTWKRRLALSYYHQGQYRDALDALPGLNEAPSRDERRRIMSLKGSLHYRLGEWEQAREVFESMTREFSRLEPKYYLALLDEKTNESNNAIDRLRRLLETTEEDPWHSRLNYQLARLYYESGNFEEYEHRVNRVDTSALSIPLRNELDLLKLANAVRKNPGRSGVAGRAKKLREKAVKFGQLNQWYGYLVQSKPTKKFWTDVLIPTLRETDHLQHEWGPKTIAILRKQGYGELSVRTAKDLLEGAGNDRWARSVRAELLDTLRAQKRYHLLGRHLPVKSEWNDWSEPNLTSLAHALARYHRSMKQPRAGREALDTLREGRQLSDGLSDKLDEWTASFEIDRGQYQSARERLSSLNSRDRSFSGELNLAIANYHLGDTESSFQRIQNLRNARDRPDLSLYDYAFRILRDNNQTEKLHEWSQDLLDRNATPEPRARSLLLDNVKYWVNNGHTKQGLEYIRQLETEIKADNGNHVPLEYYRALAHFNEGDLSRAESTLQSLRENHNPEDRWLRRILQSEMEISLRRNNWAQAYERWQTLNEAGLGSSGQRLLTENGLKSSPEAFENLVETLGDRYENTLPDGEAVFWQARLDEHRNNPDRAADRYKSYLDRDFGNHRQRASVRLARLYDTLGEHDQALEKYRELYSGSGEEQYRLRMGVQLRKLGRFEESRNRLEKVIAKSNGLRALGRYQLGYTHLENGNTTDALGSFRQALEDADPSADWLADARRRTVEIALREEELTVAESLVPEISDDTDRRLFRAELRRRQGRFEDALKQLESIAPTNLSGDRREQYRSIASAVYWQTDNYSRLLELYEDLPDGESRKEWYVKSLIKTGELQRAREIVSGLTGERQSVLRVPLADAFYENSRWEEAVQLYEKVPGTLRTRFRIGNAQRKIGDDEKAYGTWKKALTRSSDGSDSEWVGSIIEGLVVLTPDLQRHEETARMIDDHWSSVVNDRNRIAVKALRWSIQANNTELTNRFLGRVDNPEASSARSIAKKLAANRNWGSLETWVQTVRTSDAVETDAHFLNYYSLLARFRTDSANLTPQEINKHLNEALEAQSSFAPDFQVLLGDYHYENENFKQAAIEYRKVDLLFDNKSPDPEVQLQLARSYLEIEQPEKARSIFQSLDRESVPDTIRKEAKEWLRQKPDS